MTRSGWLAAAALYSLTGWAQEPAGAGGTQLPLLPDSRFTVEGTSNVNPFSCKLERLAGAALLAPGADTRAELPEPTAVAGMEVSVPVEALDCANGVMAAKARTTLRADEHPQLRFRLGSLGGGEKTKGKLQLLVRGELTVAGQTRPVEFPVVLSRPRKEQLQVSGSLPLTFSQFGLEPPTELAGTLRVNDPLTVHFDLRFAAPPR